MTLSLQHIEDVSVCLNVNGVDQTPSSASWFWARGGLHPAVRCGCLRRRWRPRASWPRLLVGRHLFRIPVNDIRLDLGRVPNVARGLLRSLEFLVANRSKQIPV